MKKIIGMIAILCMMFSFVGCAKCISTEYRNVEVNIVDEYYRGMRVMPIKAGEVTTVITRPAVYQITVEYNGVKYIIIGSATYNKYKDKVGETAIGTLKICTYDDGTVRYDITNLE